MTEMSLAKRTAVVIGFLLFAILSPVEGSCKQGELPWQTGDVVWNSWQVTSIELHPEFLRYHMKKGDNLTTIEITFRRSDSNWATKHYLIQPAPGESPPIALVRAVRAGVEKFEKLPGQDRLVARQRFQAIKTTGKIFWHPHRVATGYEQRSFYKRLLSGPTLAIELILLLGLILLGLRIRKIIELAGRVARFDWILLSFWTVIGAALRLLGGVRVPGFTNCTGYAHGFGLLRDVLVWDPLGVDPHGNGFHALYGLVLSVFPNTEFTVVICQFVLSMACIPLIYLVSRFFLKQRSWALWAAAVMAVLPAHVFFAATEIRLVPGVFFMLLGLGCLGLAIKDQNPISLLAAALTGVVATQFYPTLMPLPLVMLALALAGTRGRHLFHRAWTWVAAGLFLALWIGPAIWMMSMVASTEHTVLGADFLKCFADSYRMFVPSNSLVSTSIYSVFLNSNFTPPVFWILALGGFIVGLCYKSSRILIIVFFGAALLLSFSGLFPGRMNLARLQQGGLPFYAVLSGVGLGFLLDRLKLTGRLGFVSYGLGAVVVLGSVLVWPGPIGKSYTLQFERRSFIRGLDHLDDGCKVIWAPGPNGTNHDVPSYLAEERGRKLEWGALTSTDVPKDLIKDGSCLYYYRTSTCFTVSPNERRDEMLRPECAAVEKQLEMKKVFVEEIPGLPDDMSEYQGSRIPVGFFRIVR